MSSLTGNQLLVDDVITKGIVRDIRAYNGDLVAALSDIGATECTLLVSQPIEVYQDVTIPENVTLKILKGCPITIGAKASTTETIATGDGATTSFTYTVTDPPISRQSVVVTYTIGGTTYTATDTGTGIINGTNLSGVVDYLSGTISLTFSVAPDNGTNIDIAYTPTYQITVNGNIEAGLWEILKGGEITGNPKIECVYPEWFGAKGDGLSDDTIPLALSLKFSKKVFLSDRTYRITKTIIWNTGDTFYLEGKHSWYTVIQHEGTGAVFEFTTGGINEFVVKHVMIRKTNKDAPIFLADLTQPPWIYKPYFECARLTGGTHAIKGAFVDGVMVNCTIYGASVAGIEMKYGIFELIGCNISNCNAGIKINSAHSYICSNCAFGGNSTHILIDGSTSLFLEYQYYHNFESCWFENSNGDLLGLVDDNILGAINIAFRSCHLHTNSTVRLMNLGNSLKSYVVFEDCILAESTASSNIVGNENTHIIIINHADWNGKLTFTNIEKVSEISGVGVRSTKGFTIGSGFYTKPVTVNGNPSVIYTHGLSPITGYAGNLAIALQGWDGVYLFADSDLCFFVYGGFPILGRRYTPVSSTDIAGVEGAVCFDDNYLYVKTSVGWKRVALSSF